MKHGNRIVVTYEYVSFLVNLKPVLNILGARQHMPRLLLHTGHGAQRVKYLSKIKVLPVHPCRPKELLSSTLGYLS